MKRVSLLILAAICIFSGLCSYSYQSNPSFEDANLTPKLKKLIDKDTSRVLFLFGILGVGEGTIGNYIYEIKNDTDVLFIFNQGSTANDIYNFKRGLQVKGKIIVATEEMIEFVKGLSKKMSLDDYQHNFILVLKNKKIENIAIH